MPISTEERDANLKSFSFSNPKMRRTNWAIIQFIYEELLKGNNLSYFNGSGGIKFTPYVEKFIETIKNYEKTI